MKAGGSGTSRGQQCSLRMANDRIQDVAEIRANLTRLRLQALWYQVRLEEVSQRISDLEWASDHPANSEPANTPAEKPH